MGVVQRHGAHATQAAHHTGALVAVHGAQLGDADGQLTVAVEPRLVDQDVVRAVHGPQHQLLVLQLHGRKHALPVVLPVA